MKNLFSLKFKNLRLENGLKQSEIARVLRTTQRRISYWESGEVEPDLDSLLQIAEYFDISVDELLGRNGY